MRSINKIGLLVFLIAISITSCEKIIDANLEDSNRRIVVNSTFAADSIINVNISKSLHVLDNSSVLYLSNAEVKIYENDQYIEKLQNLGNGDYCTQTCMPVYGKTYKLTVSSAGLDNVQGSNSLPAPVAINGIDTMLVKREYEERMQCTITIDDPGNIDNYYYLQIMRKQEFYIDPYLENKPSDRYAVYFDSNDPVVEEWVNWGEGAIFSDAMFNGKEHKLDIEIYSGDIVSYDTTGTVLYYYLNSISREYYLYQLSLAMYQRTNGDFFAEPVRVYTNITNGLGIFAGYSTSMDSVVFNGYYDPYYQEW